MAGTVPACVYIHTDTYILPYKQLQNNYIYESLLKYKLLNHLLWYNIIMYICVI